MLEKYIYCYCTILGGNWEFCVSIWLLTWSSSLRNLLTRWIVIHRLQCCDIEHQVYNCRACWIYSVNSWCSKTIYFMKLLLNIYGNTMNPEQCILHFMQVGIDCNSDFHIWSQVSRVSAFICRHFPFTLIRFLHCGTAMSGKYWRRALARAALFQEDLFLVSVSSSSRKIFSLWPDYVNIICSLNLLNLFQRNRTML